MVAIDAGDDLKKAKKKLDHGEWMDWLEKNCALSDRTARVYMQLADGREIIEARIKAATEIQAATETAIMAESDAQLMAIGLVAVQWSILESYLKAIAHGLFQDDAAREKFDQTLVFRHRLRIVRDLIDERVMAPFSGDLIAIIDRIGALALERDRIIHGTWSSDQPAPVEPDNPGPNDRATHVSATAKPKPAFEWKLDYGRIMETASKIAAVPREISEYLVNAMGRPPNFLMSDALKRISRKTD
jgi:hypothetical protein